MEEILVSVIIPVYNCHTYLDRAVKSVVDQTYTHTEIILVDDGSTDSTVELCDRWEELDERISVYHKQNGGISDARNFGVNKTHGEFICFLDADDELHLDFIARLLKLAIEYNTKMTVCGYCSVLVDGSVVKSPIYLHECVIDNDECLIEYCNNRRFTSHPWGKLYHRSLFKDVRYPVGKNYEDIFVMPKLLKQCNKIAFVNDNLINYYQIQGSITNKIDLKNELDAFEATHLKYKEYENLNIYSELIKEPIEIALRIKLHARLRKYKLENKDKKRINLFLREHSKNKLAYSNLNNRFKICLKFYFLL